MSLVNEIDDRTVEEQLRDLGVEVIRKNSNAFGAGDYQGKRVILLRESKSGYKFSIVRKDGSEYATTHTPGLVKQLLSAGIKQGRYILYEIRGGWMGVLE